MLDPVTLLATATAVFNGLKKAVELGREAEDVFGQLGKWASAVSDLQEWMSGAQAKPPLFGRIVFAKSATAEAFDEYAAQVALPTWPLDSGRFFRVPGALSKDRRAGTAPAAPHNRAPRQSDRVRAALRIQLDALEYAYP